MKSRPGNAATHRTGFTLAEVAVTLLIVSIGLVLVLQGLTGAKLSAAETHHRKLARELALLTLGQLEAGLFWEELDGGGDVLTGSYAEEGCEDYSFELVLGDEEFRDERGFAEDGGYHDTWRHAREREERARDDAGDDDEDEEEETAEPFEKVRIKVVYPQLGERSSALVLERWMAWEDVYGEDEEAAEGAGSSAETEEP